MRHYDPRNLAHVELHQADQVLDEAGVPPGFDVPARISALLASRPKASSPQEARALARATLAELATGSKDEHVRLLAAERLLEA